MNTKDAVLKFEYSDDIAVAFHPTPQGIIQFVGGYGFGAFPTSSYRKLLEQLFVREYTLVVFSYLPVTNHLTIAEALFRRHKRFRDKFLKKAEEMGLEPQVYTDPKNYFWLGHSLGCEYITLLELLSSKKQLSIKDANGFNILKTEANKNAIESILQMSCQLNNTLPIRGQSSLLIAPCFKAASVMNLFVKPTQQQIWNSIEESSDIFNLTALISFAGDRIAGHQSDCNRVQQIEKGNACSDVCFLTKNLKLEESNLCCELPGNHYMPLCLDREHNSLVNVAIDYLQELRKKAG